MDREKVIKGLECIVTNGKCDLFNCPYWDASSCINAVSSDAIALLKEQAEEIERLKTPTAGGNHIPLRW